MSKQKLMLILVLFPTLSHSMQRTVMLHNGQKEVITVKFLRPDSGFNGPHIIIKEKITLEPEESILTSVPRSIVCLTPTKKFTLKIPKNVSQFSIKNDPYADT